MIVGFEELERYRRRVAMVDGAFDPLHAGHIEYFREVRALGLPVLCNVASDAYVGTKHAPLIPAAQRIAIVDAIRYIDDTHLNRTCDACTRHSSTSRSAARTAASSSACSGPSTLESSSSTSPTASGARATVI